MAGIPPKAEQKAPPVVRILADSAEQFVRAFAGTFRGGKFFLRNPKPLAVGRRVRVEIATRTGAPLVSGDAVVSEVVEPSEGGPANRLTFTKVDNGKELLERLTLPPGLRPAGATPPPMKVPVRGPDPLEATRPDVKPAPVASEVLNKPAPRPEPQRPAPGTATMEWAMPEIGRASCRERV